MIFLLATSYVNLMEILFNYIVSYSYISVHVNIYTSIMKKVEDISLQSHSHFVV